MNAKQKEITLKLTNLFENGTFEPQYSYCEYLGDGRGYTAGIIGFTTATGDALECVSRYTWHKPHNPLAKYLPELKRLDSLPDDSPERGNVSRLHGFPQAWKEAAKDPVFRAVQDELLDEWYFQPAINHAARAGVKTALGQAIYYDTMVQHGDGSDEDSLLAIVDMARMLANGFPKMGIPEELWLLHFLEARRRILLHAHNPDTREVWRQSVGRVDALKQWVAAKNFDLHTPFTFTWEGEKYTIH